jgi:hypothetical protein
LYIVRVDAHSIAIDIFFLFIHSLEVSQKLAEARWTQLVLMLGLG